MIRALVLILLLIAGPAFGQSSKVHDLATNTTNPIPAGSCLYVDQNSLDTKLCVNWAATLGAMLPDLSNMTATALPSAFTLPSPILTGTVAGANTIPLSVLFQIPQRTLLGNTTTGTANVGSGWTVSGTANTVASTTGTLTNGHCVDIDVNGNLVDAGAACSSGGGGGSVTSVGLSVPAASIFGVTGSPITTAGTLGLTTTGTSGGIPYFSSGTQLSTSAQMPANHAITGGGAGASPKDSKVTITVPATGSTLTIADGKTLTANSTLTLAGVDSKTLTVNNTLTLAAGADSQTFTLPTATDTILGRASTDTLTNKTYDTAGTGNVFKISGAQLTAITGTGTTVALSTSPTFVTPALGAATGTSLDAAANPAITTAITTAGFQVRGNTNSGNTPTSIYNMTCASCSLLTYDAISGTATQPTGSTVTAVNGVAGYVLNQNVTAGIGQNSVALFGIGVGAVSGGGTWGINTLLTDSTAQSVGTSFSHNLWNEFDFNVWNTSSVIKGVTVRGASGAQPTSSIGYEVGLLDVSGANRAQWGTGVYTVAGCCTIGVGLGQAGTGSNVGSQSLYFQSKTAGGVTNAWQMNVNTGGASFLFLHNFATAATWVFDAPVVLKGYTVDTLPTGVTGATAYVTDGVACTFLATPVHNGATVCPVFYNGSAWVGG